MSDESEAGSGQRIFLNGAMADADESRIDPRDRGFLLGDGVFETLRVRDGIAERLEAHLARLRHGAAVLGIPIPLDGPAIGAALKAVLAENRLDKTLASARITLSRGPGGRGLPPPDPASPTLMITTAPVPDRDPGPARVLLSDVPRNRRSPTANIKCLGYADQVIARMRATKLGCDEALMPNDAGRLACASSANLFLLCGNTLATPSLDEGVLAGITRAALLPAARGLGLDVQERPVAPGELADADAVLLTNSLIGVRTVSEVIAEELPHRPLFRSHQAGPAAQLAAALAAPAGSG